jgi:hypothetical protein
VDCVAAVAITGERCRPAFFAVFSVGAANLEQNVNFCLHAYAVRGIYVYIGIRMAAGGTFARPGPTTLKIQFLPKQPAPSPLFTAPATRHRRSPFSCRACSCFATFSGRRRTHAASAVIVSAAKPSTVLPPLARRFPSASSSRCRDPQKRLTTQPVAPALRGNVSWRRGLLRCARNDGECGHAPLFSAYPRSPSSRRWHQNKK